MSRARGLLCVTWLCLTAPCWAATIAVTNTNDSGVGSLRSAIAQASAASSADTIVFQTSLLGETIYPLTALPVLSGSHDAIDGDIDDDGTPDITLDGVNLTAGDGLRLRSPYVPIKGGPAGLLENGLGLPRPILLGPRVVGLAVVRFPGNGIAVTARNCTYIHSCCIGVDRLGQTFLPNQGHGIQIAYSDFCTVGGADAAKRNLILGYTRPSSVFGASGIYAFQCEQTTIAGNYFGLNRAGTAALGAGGSAVLLNGGAANVVGGTTAGKRNVFGGSYAGVTLRGEHGSVVQGNYFGLGANGNTPIPLSVSPAVSIAEGATDCVVGGPSAAQSNVFCASGSTASGVYISGHGTDANRVQRNYFGSNAAGTAQRPLARGVFIAKDAGPQTIGSKTNPKAGNYFTTTGPASRPAVLISNPTGGVYTVANNEFGVLKNGTTVGVSAGVVCTYGTNRVAVTDNLFAQAEIGVRVFGSEARIFRNVFRQCGKGVVIEHDAPCNLGRLDNASATDDGGNVFRLSNTWHIWNDTPNRIRAEGNDFSTTARAAIDAKIYDRLDDATKGRVDFDPLIGGVSPTGAVGPLALTAATASPTAAGAEIAFSLSAPARVTVEVRNLAGRPVAAVLREASTEPGMQRVLWNGCTLSGTAAPAGTYLVSILAAGPEGQTARSLCTLVLR